MTGRRVGLGAVAALVVLSSPVRSWRRWSLADDATDGAPLDLPEGEDFTVTAPDGAGLACRRCGPIDGPTVVLAHGWTADRRVWAATARRLVAAGRQVVVYDQRGHGSSSASAVGTLVLVSTASGDMSYGPRYEAVATAVVGADRVTRTMGGERLGPFLVRSSFGRKPALAPLQATAASFATTPVTTRVELLAAMAAMDLTPGLPTIPVPVVIVSGTRDTLTLHRASQLLHRLIPGSTLEVVKGAGHQLVFEVPDRLADILLQAAHTPAQPTALLVPTSPGGTP